jgi:hypothetical protein
MVTTRSATKQTHLEDTASTKHSTEKKPSSERLPDPKTSRSDHKPPPSKKRKTASTPSQPPKKKLKTIKSSKITINRAPVLKLWAACVTQVIHPSLPWSTCLSAGTAISAICAVGKGRSIGKIDPQDDQNVAKKKKKRVKDEDDFKMLEVMHFKLNLKSEEGLVYFGGKPQAASEETLKKKFGESYNEAKAVFEEELEKWKGAEEGLGEQGFGMYEGFRPTVPKGEKGWGRKGVLDLENVRKIVGNGM